MPALLVEGGFAMNRRLSRPLIPLTPRGWRCVTALTLGVVLVWVVLS